MFINQKSIALIIGLLSIGAQAAPKPEPSPQLSAANTCKTITEADFEHVANGRNVGMLTKTGVNYYTAKDSKGNIKWEVTTNPLKIISYPGQMTKYNSIFIYVDNVPFRFQIEEGTECVEADNEEYQRKVNANIAVNHVLHVGLNAFPAA